MLFAEASGAEKAFFLFALAVGFIGYVIFRAHIYLNRPDIWQAEQRLKIEKEQQRFEQRARNRNQMAAGIMGAVLKAFFGHRN